MTDIPASTGTTTSIAVGGTLTDSLETVGDHDWVRITLTAGQKIVISLGAYGGSGVDTYLYLRDSSGNLLTENDDGGPGTDSRLVFTAPSSGTYYIDVGAWNDQSAGAYQLSVQTYTPPPVYTDDQIANQLVNGYWNNDFHHWNVTQGGTITVNLTALTPEGQNLARAALAEWSDIIGVHFNEVSTGGQMVFDDSQDGAFTSTNYTNHIITDAQINISAQWIADYGSGLDSYSFQTYIHEIGHALGLGHGGDYNGDADYSVDALYANDSWSTTVMSYFSQVDNVYFSDRGFTYNFAETPMVADILAMQSLYGLSTTTRTGNTTYGFNSNAGRPIYDASVYPSVAYTIFDNGGVDTLNYSGFSANQVINLNAETFSSVGGYTGNVAIARGTVIENATGGSGNDTLIGNAANNVLNGGGGFDTVSYATATAGVTVSLSTTSAQNTGGAGVDTLIAIENLTGSAFADDLRGGALANTINGGAGNDRIVALGGNDLLDGGAGADRIVALGGDDTIDGGAGADFMRGGTGNDIYYVDNVNDKPIENAGEGVDTVMSSVTFALSLNIENLTLTGSAFRASGNNLSNHLVGTSGDNILNGGLNADVMTGGGGNDLYYVDNVSDTIVENNGGGRDRIYTSVSFTTGANVEDIFLRGASAINATGNALDNVLRGNSANNVLDGAAGADTYRGAGGADTFVFNDGDFAGLTPSTSDRIVDFSHAEGDRIDLTGVDANSTVFGDQSFLFIGSADFHHIAGELRYQTINGNTYVYGDTNGDGAADFMIRLDGSHALVSGDFGL
jgi:serralysin